MCIYLSLQAVLLIPMLSMQTIKGFFLNKLFPPLIFFLIDMITQLYSMYGASTTMTFIVDLQISFFELFYINYSVVNCMNCIIHISQ